MRIIRISLATVAVLAIATAADMAWRHGAPQQDEAAGAAVAEAPAAPPAMPAMPVPVAAVVEKSIPVYLDYSARTEAIRTVSLQAKVSGFVAEQDFTEGSDVGKGALLYRLDPRDFEAALDQAKALADQGSAALDYAKATADRSSALVQSGSLAKDAFDQRTSALRQAEASVAVNHAAVRTAELNLGYTEIRAPFAGRIGRDKAPVGTLVAAGGSPLNTLVQLDPIYVTFNPSEGDLAQVLKARAGGPIKVEITLPGVSGAVHEGELTFLDNAVDPETGTITARAKIANGDSALLPGQYVRARLQVGEQANVLLVPQAAIGSSQLGKYVYVVGKDDKVEQRHVTVGRADGDLVAVAGVEKNDRIITGNLQKIGPGAPVQPLPVETALK